MDTNQIKGLLELVSKINELVSKINETAEVVQTVQTTMKKGDYSTRKLTEGLVTITEKLLEKAETDLTGSVDLTSSEESTLKYDVKRLQEENAKLKAENIMLEKVLQTDDKKRMKDAEKSEELL